MSKFVIDGTTYEMIESRFTFAEARAVEKVSGVSFQDVMDGGAKNASIDVTQALLWISMKRVDPTLTFADLDDVAIDEIEWPEDDEPEADAPDPTDAAPVAPVPVAPPSQTSD